MGNTNKPLEPPNQKTNKRIDRKKFRQYIREDRNAQEIYKEPEPTYKISEDRHIKEMIDYITQQFRERVKEMIHNEINKKNVIDIQKIEETIYGKIKGDLDREIKETIEKTITDTFEEFSKMDLEEEIDSQICKHDSEENSEDKNYEV